MKSSWSSISFIDSIKKTGVGRENQILAADIQPSGRFPVVDQGKDFIAGYSNAKDRVVSDNLPVVIFGDHTRCLKYVDFPFILGADGTKVLKPEEDLFDTKFFYYALLGLDIPNRGYNRHFTLLKEKKIPHPEKDEQKKIAAILDVLERAIEQQERIIQVTTELKKSLMQKLFTEGIRGEPQKQTEIGSVPESWKVVRFDDFSTLQRGKDLTKTEFQTGFIPVFGSNGIIGYHDVANVEGPGVTVGRSGSVGKVVYYQKNFWAHNTSLYVRNFHGNDPRFVAYYLEHLRLDRFRSGASVPTLDRNQFKEMPVAVPPLKEQQEIAYVLKSIDHKLDIVESKRRALTDFFQTLLHQLMTAHIRVDEIDLQDLKAATTH